MESGVVTQTYSTEIPRFLLTGNMDDTLCKEFINFHTNSVKNGVTEALIYIDSPGGNINVLSTIAGLIQNGEVLYHTIAMGHACSAACILTAFGSFRWALPETLFMFHDASFFVYGNVKQLEESLTIQKVFIKKMMDKFSAHTNRSSDFWLDLAYSKVNNDLYFDSQQALEYGVIDFIGMPTISRQSSFVVELPIEMDKFEELMQKRGVQTEDLSSSHTSSTDKSQKKKMTKKMPKKKPAIKKRGIK